MNQIKAQAKSIKELLTSTKYTIDFYQREYGWQERQIRELIDDLSGKFLNFFDQGHERVQVKHYGHYFLGSIVISHKNSQRYIVDGQQRLTTLSLLLIYLYHLQSGRPDQVDVRSLVFSEEFGQKSFNLNVPDRNPVMSALLHAQPFDLEGAAESLQNIWDRYHNIADHLPDDVTEYALPYFVDWLLNNVHLVEIEADNDEDAYTIFETMNDRGLPLSLPEMLKGYVLANIRELDDQKRVNDLWKGHMQSFKDLGGDEDGDFFKNWLRARHAQNIRPGKKGAENKDYERIGSEFHRWVRDHRADIGLTNAKGASSSQAFVSFVCRDLDFYAKQTVRIRQAARKLTPGMESIRYNEERGFTLQTQLLLAAISPDDPKQVTDIKLKLVSDFLDIWLARRVWNFRTIAYSSVRYTLFTFTKEVRDKSLPELVAVLQKHLEQQAERFVTQTKLRLHQQNYRQVRHVLARLTHWVDHECGLATHFDDLVSAGRARPFEIEHIWANHYDRYAEVFASPSDFDTARNHIGGLILLQRGLNQSLGDASYEKKREAYAVHSQNLLARSLNDMAYVSNPAFKQFLSRTGLDFKPYDHFGPEEQAERQELYIRLAEWVWNPGRITLDGVPAPQHLPLPEEKASVVSSPLRLSARQATRKQFWTRLLDHAKSRNQIHKNTSPGSDSWVSAGAGKTGMTFNYIVAMQFTRAELYINTNDRTLNKSLFDQLHVHRASIDAAFGAPLAWERMDDKNTCRIHARLDLGGWAEDQTWDQAIPPTVQAMERLHAAISGYIPSLDAKSST